MFSTCLLALFLVFLLRLTQKPRSRTAKTKAIHKQRTHNSTATPKRTADNRCYPGRRLHSRVAPLQRVKTKNRNLPSRCPRFPSQCWPRSDTPLVFMIFLKIGKKTNGNFKTSNFDAPEASGGDFGSLPAPTLLGRGLRRPQGAILGGIFFLRMCFCMGF